MAACEINRANRLHEWSGTRSDSNWSAISWPAYAALAYSGIVATVIAMLLWLSSVQRIGAIRTSVYQYLLLVIGLLVSLVLLREGLDIRQSIGATMLLGGLIVALRA